MGPLPFSTETVNEKATSSSQGINREHSNVVKPSDPPASNYKSTKSTVQAAVAPEGKAERQKEVEKKPASKPPAVKREQSDVFKSFSKPNTKLKHEDTAIAPDASPLRDTALSVRFFLLFD